VKRCAVGFLVFVGVLALIVWGGRAHYHRVGTERLNAVSAKLDTEEPGWRLDAILARRQQQAPPPGRNAADLVVAVGDQVAPERNKLWAAWRQAEGFQERDRSNHRLPPEWVEHLDKMREHTAAVREQARSLRGLTAGYYPLTVGDNPYMALLPHLSKAREVAALLEYDALLASANGDPDTAIRAAHAALNVGRSIGDEPTLISQLVRIACDHIAAQAAFQALAWGKARQGLPELQAAFTAEADEPWLLHGLRGERGSIDRTFAGLASGKLTSEDFVVLGLQTPGPLDHAAFRLYKAFVPEDHAAALRILSEYIAAARLPHHEQAAALAAVQFPPRPPDDFRYLGTNLLLPACAKVGDASLRCRAQLLAAACLIACERFRQARGRWPESLEELPKDLLPGGVPLDPYDGKPMRFERHDDGVTVYSIGPQRSLPAQKPTELGPFTIHGVGWKLWDPDQRGLSPKPPVDPPDFLRPLPPGSVGPNGEPLPEPIPPPRGVNR
jgi:hypothetical protein